MAVVKRPRTVRRRRRRRITTRCSIKPRIKRKSMPSMGRFAHKRPRHHRMQTRLCTVDAARNAVFETTELLEQILKHADIQSLLNSRQVCKLWYWTIHTSPGLKDALQYTSISKPLAWILDNETGILRLYKKGDEKAYDKAWFHRQGVCLPAKVNPLCLNRDPDSVVGKVLLRQRFRRAESLKFVQQPKFCGCSTLTVDHQLTHMQITNPPARELVVYLYYKVYDIDGSWRSKKKEKRMHVKRENGITWRKFLDGIKSQLSDADQQAVAEHRLVVDIEKSDIWAIGVVFYNDAEWKAVHSGETAVACDMTSTSP